MATQMTTGTETLLHYASQPMHAVGHPDNTAAWAPKCGAELGTDQSTVLDQQVNCEDCLRIMRRERLLAVGGTEQFARPIDHIVINNHPISGDEFAMGSLTHNTDTGEVTLTFANVHTLKIDYKDQVQR